MSSSINTPAQSYAADSDKFWRFFVEKMRFAAEWKPISFVPLYQKGDIVFFNDKIYIKKTVANNGTVNPSANTADWVSLEEYIKITSSTYLGTFRKGSSSNPIPLLDAYLGSLSDPTNPTQVNLAICGYHIAQYLGKSNGNYSFVLITTNPPTSQGYFFVEYTQLEDYQHTRSFGFNGTRNFFLCSAQGVNSYRIVSTDVVQQLGYVPEKCVKGTVSYNGSSWVLSEYVNNGWDSTTPLTIQTTDSSTFVIRSPYITRDNSKIRYEFIQPPTVQGHKYLSYFTYAITIGSFAVFKNLNVGISFPTGAVVTGLQPGNIEFVIYPINT